MQENKNILPEVACISQVSLDYAAITNTSQNVSIMHKDLAIAHVMSLQF